MPNTVIASTSAPNHKEKPNVLKSSSGNSSDKESYTQSSQLSEDYASTSQTDRNCEQIAPVLKMPTEHLLKVQAIRHLLEKDLYACDAKWTLFVAAAFSYRYDCDLQPFPPSYIDQINGQQINELVFAIKDTPNLKIILQYITNQLVNDIPKHVIDLLHWVLVVLDHIQLRLVQDREIIPLFEAVQGRKYFFQPSFVFEVVATHGFHSEKAFRERNQGKPTNLGYCGQILNSVYSMLNNGFDINANEPFKLTNDFYTGVSNSPCGPAWGASQCGSIISCTALCEFASDKERDKFTTNARDESCVDIELNDANKLRARYLIFYGSRCPTEKFNSKPGGISGWFSRHKYCVYLASYILLLLSIGVVNSGNGQSLKHYVVHRIQDFLTFIRKFAAID